VCLADGGGKGYGDRIKGGEGGEWLHIAKDPMISGQCIEMGNRETGCDTRQEEKWVDCREQEAIKGGLKAQNEMRSY